MANVQAICLSPVPLSHTVFMFRNAHRRIDTFVVLTF